MTTKKDLLVALISLDGTLREYVATVPPAEEIKAIAEDFAEIDKDVNQMTTEPQLAAVLQKTQALQQKVQGKMKK